MHYSHLTQTILLGIVTAACTTSISALPTASAPAEDVVDVRAVFENIERGYIPDPNAVESPNPSLEKRYFKAPECRTGPAWAYGNQNAILQIGIPYLRSLGSATCLVSARDPNNVCDTFWCKNFETHRSSISLCKIGGVAIPCARLADAAEKIALDCKRDDWKVYGRMDDTTGYWVEVNGVGCQ